MVGGAGAVSLRGGDGDDVPDAVPLEAALAHLVAFARADGDVVALDAPHRHMVAIRGADGTAVGVALGSPFRPPLGNKVPVGAPLAPAHEAPDRRSYTCGGGEHDGRSDWECERDGMTA